MKKISRQQIAYRCPECGMASVGFLGGLYNTQGMIRLKCECDKMALEIRSEGTSVKIGVPCIYCKDMHTFTLSRDIMARDTKWSLQCPHSHHDILFVANEEEMELELQRSGEELAAVLTAFEAEDIKDIQPMDVDEAEAAPDPAIYDVLNFVLRDLEAAEAVECPCKRGPFELRFTDGGAEAVCASCGASYLFHATSQASAESYLSLDKIKLS